MNPQFFIGYNSIEGLCEGRDTGQEIYLNSSREVRTSNAALGIQTATYKISVALLEEGKAHYVLLNMGSFTLIGSGKVYPGEEERAKLIARLVEQAEAHIADWLHEQGFSRIRAASVAMPDDLRFIEGGANFLRHDKERKTMVRADIEHGERATEVSR